MNLLSLSLLSIIVLTTGCMDNPSPTKNTKQVTSNKQQVIKKIVNNINKNAQVYIRKTPVHINTIFKAYAEYRKNMIKKWNETTEAYNKRTTEYKSTIQNVYVLKMTNYEKYYNADLKKGLVAIKNTILGKEHIGSDFASNGYELKYYRTLSTEIPIIYTYPKYKEMGNKIVLDGTFTPSEYQELVKNMSMIYVLKVNFEDWLKREHDQKKHKDRDYNYRISLEMATIFDQENKIYATVVSNLHKNYSLIKLQKKSTQTKEKLSETKIQLYLEKKFFDYIKANKLNHVDSYARYLIKAIINNYKRYGKYMKIKDADKFFTDSKIRLWHKEAEKEKNNNNIANKKTYDKLKKFEEKYENEMEDRYKSVKLYRDMNHRVINVKDEFGNKNEKCVISNQFTLRSKVNKKIEYAKLYAEIFAYTTGNMNYSVCRRSLSELNKDMNRIINEKNISNNINIKNKNKPNLSFVAKLLNNYLYSDKKSEFNRVYLLYSFLISQGINLEIPLEFCSLKERPFSEPALLFISLLNSKNKKTYQLLDILYTKENAKIGKYLLGDKKTKKLFDIMKDTMNEEPSGNVIKPRMLTVEDFESK